MLILFYNIYLALTTFGVKLIMFRLSFLFFVMLLSSECNAQSLTNIVHIQPQAEYENIHVHKLEGDTLVSSFVIWVKHSVPLHKHKSHSEHVYVLEGSGKMQLDGVEFLIKKGDIIFIPKNTIHGVEVTSSMPLKVLSIQAPKFIGKDRVSIKK